MPAFREVFIQKQLQPMEYAQLVDKGYLKLRIQLTRDHLQLFESEYKVGDPFVFHFSSNQDIETKITSIDTGELHDDVYRVFIGFTLY